jgi:Mce-associated membrane protein
MTGTLEAPIYPPEEEGATPEAIEKPPVARASRSKATARTKPTIDTSASSGAASAPAGPSSSEPPDAEAESTPAKVSRSRSTAPATAGRRAKVSGSAHVSPVEEDLSNNGSEVETTPVKPSRSRATASATAGRRAKINGSAHVSSVEEDLSANGSEVETTPVKPSRSRPAASGAARRKAKANGSVLPVEELDERSLKSSEVAVESPVIHSADSEDDQPSSPATGSQQETARRRIPSWVAIRSWIRGNLVLSSLAVALVVAVVFLTLTRLSLNNEDSLNSARTSAAAAAKSYAVDLASYNYKNLNQDFGKVLGESTPAFKSAFNQSTEDLKTSLTRYDASASATVVAVGLLSATTSRAVALVFLNQTVNNTIQKSKPSTTESRVEITLLRSGGRWLINQVSLL